MQKKEAKLDREKGREERQERKGKEKHIGEEHSKEE